MTEDRGWRIEDRQLKMIEKEAQRMKNGKRFLGLDEAFWEKKEALLYLFSYFSNIPLTKPKFINFGFTHRCSLRCKICDTFEEEPKIEEELNIGELKRVIDDMADWGNIHLSFAGGEPFIRKDDLIECIIHANRRGLTTHVTTNGMHITEKIAKEIVAGGLNYLQISLDGIKEETNDYIRDKGCYSHAMDAIHYVQDEIRHQSSPLKLSLTTVVTNKNLDELLPLYQLAKNLGLYGVDYNPYVIDTSYIKDKNYDNEFWVSSENISKLRQISQEMINLKAEEGKVAYAPKLQRRGEVQPQIGTPFTTLELLPEYFNKRENFNSGLCMAGYSYMYVKPDGKVEVCGKGPGTSVRERSIRAIWYSPSFFRTRLRIMACKKPCLMLCFPRIKI